MSLTPSTSSSLPSITLPPPPPSSSHVALVVCSTLAGLVALAFFVGVALWYFGPSAHPPPGSFARLDTHDTSWPTLRPGGGRRGSKGGTEVEVHVDVEAGIDTASSYLGDTTPEKPTPAPLVRKWSASSFYRRWAGLSDVEGAGEKDSQWWNPLAEEGEARQRREREQEPKEMNLTRKPSRISRIHSLRWPSTAAPNRMSDIEEVSNERSSMGSLGRQRLSVAIPSGDAQGAEEDDDGFERVGPIPTILSPTIPRGPNAARRAERSGSSGSGGAEVDASSPLSLTPSFRSYLQAIQRSLSSASFGARSFATIANSPTSSPTTQLPFPTTSRSSSGDDALLLRPQLNPRPISSSTFGRPHNPAASSSHPPHPTPPTPTVRLPPVGGSTNVSPAQSFGSSFARYVDAIQRSLSRSTAGTAGPSRSSTRGTNVSRAATHRTFGSGRSGSRSWSGGDDEEEGASLVPPLPITPSFGGGGGGGKVVVVGRDWDDDETTMESFEGSTMEEGEDDLGEVVDVLGTGMAARAEVVGGGVGGGSAGSMDGEGRLSNASSSWTVRPRPLPVPAGGGGGVRATEPWVKVVRKLPAVPS